MKKILAFALAALLALAAAGCGGSSEPSSSAPAADSGSSSAASQAETELTVLKVAASPAPHAEILNSVKEAMAAKGYDLYYWESSSTAELDFARQKDNQIIGIGGKKGE